MRSVLEKLLCSFHIWIPTVRRAYLELRVTICAGLPGTVVVSASCSAVIINGVSFPCRKALIVYI